ncbi:Sec-independent protein translocase subunit TatA [Aldersonia kunmingensis]|uniref:Sec-independent protein translocase subunit TatA n=1 Tax=Aldersonia kunmingensis TaxID=408066 RepID=UPI00082C78D8|nr:Sec-independent protein translocase subunit TatA [Aldersonia kunmingensis]
MGAMSPWHWAIVLLVLVLLFGSKKLPDAARGLGRSLRIFKSEMSEMQNDKSAPAEQAPAQPQTQQLPPAQPPLAQPTQHAQSQQPQSSEHADPRSA